METKNAGLMYKGVEQFNDLAGNLTNVTEQNIDNQLSIIFSEFTETVDAFEAGDKVELLDGVCDLFVTVTGLMQIAEKLGYNVEEAMERVNLNNLSKFKTTVLPEDGAKWIVTRNERYGRYVLKDENGKVRKPADYVSVDLSDLIPKE
jgi:hypothetical protein